jgi:Protein of unknown function (DUF2000)
VLVHDRGPHGGDLGALGQPVDHEGVQRVGAGDGDVEQEVVAARHHEHADDLRQPGGPVARTVLELAQESQVAATRAVELSYLGVALGGPQRAVRRLTGALPLLR